MKKLLLLLIIPLLFSCNKKTEEYIDTVKEVLQEEAVKKREIEKLKIKNQIDHIYNGSEIVDDWDENIPNMIQIDNEIK